MEQSQGGGPGPGPPDPGIGTDARIEMVADLQSQELHGTEGEAMQAGTEQQGLNYGEQSEQVKGRPKGRVATEKSTGETTATDRGAEWILNGTKSLAGSKVLTWSDKVRAQAGPPEIITDATARTSHMLEGIWNPLHKKHLMGTLMTDWEAFGKPDWSPEETSMRQEALAAANTACDESVRAWTQRENEIMTTYLQGRLDLPHPPNFIKEILIGEHRAMLEDMHETYFNAVLTAVVPATVKMTRNTAHAMIFKELFIANTDRNTGHAMMRALQRDVKRLRFDGIQTLSVTFYSRTAADRWQEKALRLQKAVIVLRNTQRRGSEDGTGQYTPAQLEIQYAIRVFGGETMGLATLARMFARVSDAKVLDVGYAREQRTEIYDNRYHTIRFAQRECPVALKGVSRIRMGDQDITIHHFQQNLRKPCSRCLSQRHGTIKCSVAFSKLEGMQAKATRILDGAVEQAHVAPRRDYQVESVEQLVEMLKRNTPTQSREVQLLPAYNGQPHDGTAGQDVQVVGSTTVKILKQPDASDARETTVDSDEEGFKLKEPKKSKAAKAKERKAKREAGTGRAGLTPSGAGSSGQRDSIQAASKTTSSQVTKPTTNKGRLSTPRPGGGTNKRFDKFQRTEALGRYGALADSDSEDGESNSMDVDDGRTCPEASIADEDDNDAPYAFPDTPEYAEHMPSVIEQSPAVTRPVAPHYETVVTEETKEEVNPPSPMEGITVDVQHQIITTRAVTSVKASRPTSKATRRQRQLNAGIGLPQGAIKGMQTSMANFMHQAAAVVVASTEDGGPRTKDDQQEVHGTGDVIVPATPDSQQEFTMGETRVGTAEGDRDLPIQLGQWLHSFQGHEVKVAANGQCAFLAMLASNINHKGPEMKTTTTVAKDATTTKWYVYTLMMANLRKDVELDLVNPIEECAKLYPGQPRHTSVNGATAALYVHYDTARQRSVGRNVPASFWAGPHELRALAQYLREPIIVFDVSENTDAHMQRYGYKHYRLADGTDHESGFVSAITDRDATEYLRNCWSLHVVPTFLVLRQHERHFYGVGHGELFLKWRAEGDPEYMKDITESFDWKATINEMSDYERNVDLSSVNQLADCEEVNAIVIKRLEMRDRLDLVHIRLGLPTLPSAGMVADWEAVLALEEQLIHQEYGIDHYAANSQTEMDSDVDEEQMPRRHARPATGEVMMNSYFRILRHAADAPMDAVDLPLATLVQAANQDAFTKWCTLYRKQFKIPATKRRAQTADIRAWLITQPMALRHLFAFLPYPEREAKDWTLEQLEAWGSHEAYREQMSTIERIMDDAETTDTARAFCSEWLQASTDTTIHPESAHTLAGSPTRWGRLARWVPRNIGRAQPPELTESVWRVLHILPYTVSEWTRTPLGRAPHGARGTWYTEFQFVRTLSHSITEHNDWSTATLIPTGQAWGECSEDSDSPSSSPPRH